MLVLTRRIGEEIVIDGNIHVVVLAIKGNKIRLGVSLPPSITVDRMEIHEKAGRIRRSSRYGIIVHDVTFEVGLF